VAGPAKNFALALSGLNRWGKTAFLGMPEVAAGLVGRAPWSQGCGTRPVCRTVPADIAASLAQIRPVPLILKGYQLVSFTAAPRPTGAQHAHCNAT
jgi:hypothetical protein